MDPANLAREIASLPPEAQSRLQDYLAFLKTRYPKPPASRKKGAKPLSASPFIGMWRDRDDMRDSTAWVRETRRNEWEGKGAGR
jgi:hypothetical protein